MTILDGIEGLEARIEGLEVSLGGAESVVSTFETELASLQTTMLYTNREVNMLSRSMGAGLRKAFDGLVFDGMRLSDALKSVATSMVNAAHNTAIKPVQNALGSAIANGVNGLISGILPFQNGAPFSQGKVIPFANGGIVSSPTYFPMRGATGLMGEAGPEAILPLKRGADGKLGIESGGGGRPIQINMHISTPDVAGFQLSQSQIAAEMSRAISRGQRNR